MSREATALLLVSLIAFAMVAVNVVLALATFAKGKLTRGLLAVFVPGVGLIGALRLAKPGSLWARRFYDDQRHQRTRARYERNLTFHRLHERFDCFIGGAPTVAAVMIRRDEIA